MPTERRYRFFSIGPFDDESAERFAADRQRELKGEPKRFGLDPDGSADVDCVDDRHWFARAFDPASAQTLATLLAAGLNDERITQDERWRRQGLLSDISEWLEHEYDGSLDVSEIE